MKLINLLLLLLLVIACNQKEEKEEPKVIYTTCSIADQQKSKCTRFMDRTIYFAYSMGQNPEKNNEFQKLAIRDTLTELEENTSLGGGYFKFVEVDASLIQPITTVTHAENFKSFIQVYPDTEFNELANEYGYLPDTNAITVLNHANKRQFFIVFRASCFNPNEFRCTNDLDSVMGGAGVRALVARQFGALVGMAHNCSTYSRTMCPDFPNDQQWSTAQKNYWFASFNNALETITMNPNFYEEFFVN